MIKTKGMEKAGADGLWCFERLPSYYRHNPKSIKKREAFQVGSRLYPTIRAAAKAQAWARILSKYDNPKEIVEILDHICECDDGMPGTGGQGCLIHDRRYGYFAKLAKRITDVIEKAYAEQIKAGKE